MKWITFALVATLISLHYQLWLHKGGLHRQHAQISQQAQTVVLQNQQIRQENMLLRAQVYDLKNGFETISEIARNDLGYIQDGEQYYSFKP
ncbi:FtsB family cell division protein [Neisseriaceae bacterium B1]